MPHQSGKVIVGVVVNMNGTKIITFFCTIIILIVPLGGLEDESKRNPVSFFFGFLITNCGTNLTERYTRGDLEQFKIRIYFPLTANGEQFRATRVARRMGSH